MKRLLIVSCFIGLILGFTHSRSIAQCTQDACVAKLGDGYTFLKVYNMQAGKDMVEYSYVFSKSTNYMLVVCNADGTSKDVEVTLYDSQRKLLASNYDKVNNKYYGAIVYNCQTTGIFYIKYTYKTKPTCCVSVLAFKKM
jgi:hypothetical protein